jgi:heat shock protein HslJ
MPGFSLTNTRRVAAVIIAVWGLFQVNPAGAASTTAGKAIRGKWLVTKLNGRPPEARIAIGMNFTKTRIEGTDGCNSYFVEYEVNTRNEIVIDRNSAVQTLKPCDGVTQIVVPILDVLAAHPKIIRYKDGSLTLSAKGQSAHLVRP